MKKEIIVGKTRYEIVRQIAQGGMGAIYQAKMLGVAGFEKVVAIKTMLAKFSSDKTFVERFIDEAKLVADLVHENIVQIYQLDRDGKVYYFVLEYVDGIALYELMDFLGKLREKMPVPLAVFITSRIARGLTYAHSRVDAEGRQLNIVHCDVCPHNIMINSEGVPKLTDFGIARASSMRELNSVAGKLAFMAPEQGRRNTVIDYRADIYSLGVVLFFLLSNGGYTRKVHSNMTEVLAQVREEYVDWSKLPPDLDPDLTAILKKMLAGEPGDRYQSTGDMARDLEYFIYKDGYGPTIVTLADYLRKMMPGRFTAGVGAAQRLSNPDIGEATLVLDDDERTTVIPEIDKTIRMTPEELDEVGRNAR